LTPERSKQNRHLSVLLRLQTNKAGYSGLGSWSWSVVDEARIMRDLPRRENHFRSGRYGDPIGVPRRLTSAVATTPIAVASWLPTMPTN
jgi:hypothetical protein